MTQLETSSRGILGMLDRYRLRTRLMIGFGILIILTVLIGSSSFFAMGRVTSSLHDIVEINEADTLVHQLQTEALESRRREKDFLERLDDASYEKNVAARQRALHIIQQLINGPMKEELQEPADAARSILESYGRLFDQTVEIVREIGDKDTGAYGAFRKASHDIEEVLGQESDSEGLLVHLLMLRRHEKDFLLRLDPKYIDQHRKRADEMRRALAATGLSRGAEDRVLDSLKTYTTGFQEVSALFQQREASIAQFRATIHRLDDLIVDLKASADAARKVAVEGADRLESTIRILLIVLLGFVVAISLWLARGLSDQVASSILGLTRTLTSSAAEIAATAKQSSATAAEQASTVAQVGASQLEESVVSLHSLATGMEQIVTGTGRA